MSIERRSYRITLITEMLGTVPMNPDVYKTYIESKKPINNSEDESLTVDLVEEKGWTGFHRSEAGLFIYEYMVKGFLKHAGNVLKDALKVKALRSKIDDFVFISPRKIALGKDAPDGVIERPLRAMTMQGQRVSLVRSDYVEAGLTIEFTITLLQHKELSWELIEQLLSHGEYMGLGQFRNGGYGRFTFERMS